MRATLASISPQGSTAVNASSAGSNTIVAAVPLKRIVVLELKIVCAGAVACTWESSGGTILDGPCSFAAGSGEYEAPAANGHFETEIGEALVLYLSDAVQVGGHVRYGLI